MKQLNLYQGTLGFVPVDTSKERAIQEANNGTAEDRLDRVFRSVKNAGINGAIWTDVANDLNMHHGQVSSALSVLHRSHKIVMLTTKINRCHPYVDAQWLQHLDASQVVHEPKKTMTKLKAEAGEQLAELIFQYAENTITKEALIMAAKDFRSL